MAAVATNMAAGGAAGVATPETPLIAVAAQVDVGDLALGRHARKIIPVLNLDPTNEAVIAVRVLGTPALRIVSAPDRLRPSREGFDASRQLELEFRPVSAGRFAASIEVVMGWPNDARPAQTIHVAVVGGAHDPTGPTLDEQDAERAAAERAEQEKSKHDAEQASIDRAIRAEEKRDTHFHEGHKRRLGNARQQAEITLNGVYQSRRSGIDRARGTIGEFRRVQPKDDSSLLAELAWFALDVASAGIAGGVAKRLEPALKSILGGSRVTPYPMNDGQISVHSIEEVPAGPGLVGLVTDGIKHLVKTGTKAATKQAVGGDGEEQGKPALSVDAREDFLLAHQEALVTDTMQQASDVTIRAHDALLPMLEREPDKAVDVMNRIAKELADEQPHAAAEQKQQTVVQWVRYVAQSSLGTVASRNKKTGETESLTAIRGANEKLEGNKALHRHDGLIDVSFTADFHHPEQPVKLIRARVHGVRDEVARLLAGQPMNTLGLPVRASGLLGGPSVSVTVVRDEAGTIAFTDNTTVEWQQATWLARKAGVATNGGSSDEQRGAKKLIEEEIMVKSLAEADKSLETDDAK